MPVYPVEICPVSGAQVLAVGEDMAAWGMAVLQRVGIRGGKGKTGKSFAATWMT